MSIKIWTQSVSDFFDFCFVCPGMSNSVPLVIEKLNSKNFYTWKFKMELVLTDCDLWSVVSEQKTEVSDSAWSKTDQRARANICLALGDDQLM